MPASQPANQPVNQPANQSVNQPANFGKRGERPSINIEQYRRISRNIDEYRPISTHIDQYRPGPSRSPNKCASFAQLFWMLSKGAPPLTAAVPVACACQVSADGNRGLGSTTQLVTMIVDAVTSMCHDDFFDPMTSMCHHDL